jgi:hypothetical protein
MTDEEFDNISFRKGDIIEVRHFFKTEVEEVEYVDIRNRYINNYKPQQISKYTSYGTKERKRHNH